MEHSILHTPIEYLKGVGPQRGDLLRKELGIQYFKDLIQFCPNRYIDKTKYYKINELVAANTDVQIIGKITHLKSIESNKGFKGNRLV